MTSPLLALPLYDLPRAVLRLDSMAALVAAFAPDKDLINVDRTTRRFYYRGVRFRDDLGGVGFEPDGFIVCPDASISFVQWTPAGGVVQEASLDHLKFAIAEVTCAGGLITHYEDLRDMNLLTPPGMRWRGVWNGTANYIKGDVVQDQPGVSGPGGYNLYIAKKASTGQSPPNTTYWEVVAYGLPDPATGLPGDVPAVNASGDGYELVDPTVVGGSPLDVEDEGVLEETGVNRLNFIGGKIAAVGDGLGGVDVTLVTSPGGGVVEFPDSAPDTPSQYDEEGDQAALDAKWTEVSTPGGTFSTETDRDGTFLVMSGPGAASNNAWVLRQAILDADGDYNAALTVTCKVSLTSSEGTPNIGIGLGDNAALSTGNFINAALVGGTGIARTFSTNNNGSVASTTLPGGGMTLYIHYQRNTAATNNVRIYISFDGRGWNRLLTATKTTNVDYLFVFFQGGVASQPTANFLDWLRVNDPRFLQPE